MQKQIAALATDETHVVMWDIDAVLADHEKEPCVVVPAKRLVPENWLTIDREYAMGTDVARPIIVFELPEGKFYIADGNHRVYRAAMENVSEMKAIFIPEKQHLQYLFRCDEAVYREVIRGLSDSGVFISDPRE